MVYKRTSGVWIIDTPIWICLLHTDPRIYDPPRDGKWVLNDHPNNLRRIAFDMLEPVVAQGKITFLKYRPTYNRGDGPYAGNLPPLCVYATTDRKEETFDLLTGLGLQNIDWHDDLKIRTNQP